MNFAGVAVVVTAVTLLCIFSFYRIVLYKAPETGQNPATSISQSAAPAATPQASPSETPSLTPAPRITVRGIPSNAPKSSDTITVIKNSVASSIPGSSSAISGSLYVNGTPPSGSSVVIAAKPHNSSSASTVVVNGLSPATGTSFSWNGATGSTQYDVVAVLKYTVNGVQTDIAQSPTYNLTAPTSNFQFTINVGYPLSALSGTITVTCNEHYSNNTWYATVNYPQVSGAQSYFFQLGTTSGGSDVVNIAAVDNTQDTTLNDSQNYYAQYQASSVQNPTAYQYSPFSSPQTIHCP